MPEENRKKVTRWIMPLALIASTTFVVANIYYVGCAAGGFQEWKCSGCNVWLHVCPSKRQRNLFVPASYQAHAHNWKMVHSSMPEWDGRKPWQWLAYLTTASPEAFQPIDPDAIFPTAHVSINRCDAAGLGKLAADERYPFRAEAQALFDDHLKATSAPKSDAPPRSTTP